MDLDGGFLKNIVPRGDCDPEPLPEPGGKAALGQNRSHPHPLESRVDMQQHWLLAEMAYVNSSL